MNILREWLAAAEVYSPDDAHQVEDILNHDPELEWTIQEICIIYLAEDVAIGEYARKWGLNGTLAEIEEAWIKDPEGEQKFFHLFQEEHYDEWIALMNHINPLSFMFFQLCWIFNPTRQYLVFKEKGGQPPKKEDFYPDGKTEGAEKIFERLRERFAPLKEKMEVA